MEQKLRGRIKSNMDSSSLMCIVAGSSLMEPVYPVSHTTRPQHGPAIPHHIWQVLHKPRCKPGPPTAAVLEVTSNSHTTSCN